jgi:uncharacterized protein (TIGR03083 family)
MTAGTTVGRDRPRVSTLDRRQAERLAVTEYERFTTMLAELTPDQWRMPTVCTGWDVRQVATHCLGMAEMSADPREGLRQNLIALRRAGRRGDEFIDALTALQVAEHVDLTPGQIVDRFVAVAPRAAKGRARTPGLMRRLRMPTTQPFPGDVAWSYGYLVETILTRDPWMHRVDISDATGTPLSLSADHDGVLVDDVVREWAGRHRRPCSLTLTGPAGGAWVFGAGGPGLAHDAVDFCRRVSGRAPAEGLLETQIPF